MIPNMINIKLHQLENLFRRRLRQNRVDEVDKTKQLHFYITLMQFCFFVSPLIASLCAIWVYNSVHPEKLDVQQAYFIIILVRELQTPIIKLGMGFIETQAFLISQKSILNFFFKIDDQFKSNYQLESLNRGELVLQNADFSLIDKTVYDVYREIITYQPAKPQKAKLEIKRKETFVRQDSLTEIKIAKTKRLLKKKKGKGKGKKKKNLTMGGNPGFLEDQVSVHAIKSDNIASAMGDSQHSLITRN